MIENLKKFQKHLKRGEEVEFYLKNPNKQSHKTGKERNINDKFALKTNEEAMANYWNLEEYFLAGCYEGVQDCN